MASVATTTSVVALARMAFGARLEGRWLETTAAARVRRTRRRARRAPPRTTGRGRSSTLPAAFTAAMAPTTWPIGGWRRGGADAALAIDRHRAGAGADAAEREIETGGGGRRIAELAIGREAAPILVAAVEEIEQDRGRHDRHPRGAHGKAAVLLFQPSLHAGCGIEAEGRAAGERDGVDALDRLRRIEQARSRACPARRRARRSSRPPARRTRSR